MLVRRVEDITEALWGTKVSPGTIVYNLNKKLYDCIEKWRTRPIKGSHPYVSLAGIFLKRSWVGEVRNVSELVAVGILKTGHREILSVAEGAKEDKASWLGFLKYLKERGLKGAKFITSDACIGLVEYLGDYYPESHWQRSMVHFYLNIFKFVPRAKMKKKEVNFWFIHRGRSLIINSLDEISQRRIRCV